jgi:hypothetical protein
MRDWKFGDVLTLRKDYGGEWAGRLKTMFLKKIDHPQHFLGLDLNYDRLTWPEIKDINAFEKIDD